MAPAAFSISSGLGSRVPGRHLVLARSVRHANDWNAEVIRLIVETRHGRIQGDQCIGIDEPRRDQHLDLPLDSSVEGRSDKFDPGPPRKPRSRLRSSGAVVHRRLHPSD
jgi:hypothetical protein